jgi:hypothetical protein
VTNDKDRERIEEAARRAEEAAERAEKAAREAEERSKQGPNGPGEDETYGQGRRDDSD